MESLKRKTTNLTREAKKEVDLLHRSNPSRAQQQPAKISLTESMCERIWREIQFLKF